MSSLAGKWAKEAILEERIKPLKTIQMKIFPTKKQKTILDE